MSLHQDLIEELLHGNTARTPREEAARLEILKLRGISPKEQKPLETEGLSMRRKAGDEDK